MSRIYLRLFPVGTCVTDVITNLVSLNRFVSKHFLEIAKVKVHSGDKLHHQVKT